MQNKASKYFKVSGAGRRFGKATTQSKCVARETHKGITGITLLPKIPLKNSSAELNLPFGQGIELKFAAFVPQPCLCVTHASKVNWGGVRFSCLDGAFDLLNDFWGLFGFAHPIKRLYFSIHVDFKCDNTDRIEEWRKFPLVDTALVADVQMLGSILAVLQRCARRRHKSRRRFDL